MPVHPATPRAARPALAAVVAALLLLPALAAPALAADVTVRIDQSLDPMKVTVRPGSTVTWVNESGDRHRMRSYAGPTEFDSGNMEAGDSFTVTFRREGTWKYLDERDDDDSSYWGTVVVGSDAGPGGTPKPGEPAPPATPDVITMVDRAFRPRSMTVDAGTTVRWRNNDDREHTVTSTDRAFDSGVMGQGETFSTRLSTPGSYGYLCAIHPEMTGTITVRGGSGGGSGGGGGSGPAPTPKPTPEPTPKPRATPAPGADAVRIVDLDFRPGSIDVDAGSTVVWVNQGAALHTVTAADGSWDSGMVASGDTFRRRFTDPGTYAYLCSLHPSMKGTVRVSGSGGSAPPPAARTPKPPAPPPVEPGEVDVRDFAFAPGSVVVAPGTKVTWVNAGVAPHTVTAEDGSFDSGMLASGERWSRTFDAAGTWELLCAIHPEMRATLTVAAAGTTVAPTTPAPASVSPATASPSPSAAPDAAAGISGTDDTGGPGGAYVPGAGAAVETAPAPAVAMEVASDPGAGGDVVRLGLVVLLCAGAVAAFARVLGSTVRPG